MSTAYWSTEDRQMAAWVLESCAKIAAAGGGRTAVALAQTFLGESLPPEPDQPAALLLYRALQAFAEPEEERK